jgi:uncharacterized RDD family membrane protein YckC
VSAAKSSARAVKAAAAADRRRRREADQLLKTRRIVVSPEGLPIKMTLAPNGLRLSAFLLDAGLMLAMALAVVLLLSQFDLQTLTVMTAFQFSMFLIFNFYFLSFELAWQGRTPGKKLHGLRVVARQGGELTVSAIVARNLTRMVEIYLPLGFLARSSADPASANPLVFLLWGVLVSGLPRLNKDRRRLGDFLGGTMVILAPKPRLSDDLSTQQTRRDRTYVFTPQQLAIYGNLELQILEDLLRKADFWSNKRQSKTTEEALAVVSRKICAKIGWTEPIPVGEVRNFLTDFYSAERAVLERGLLFGRRKADQRSEPQAPAAPKPPSRAGEPSAPRRPTRGAPRRRP